MDNIMNITFFIGNGFDINLGLKTQYSFFYSFFKEHAKENNMIKEWIDGNERLWADLEEKLGMELKKLTEEEIDKFYEDKEELDRLLIEYLEIEQDKYIINDDDIIKQEFSRSMIDFYDNLAINDKKSIEQTLSTYASENYIYCYITFNYTNVLDKIVGLYQQSKVIECHEWAGRKRNSIIGNVIHIHGTTNEEMILGVNDESQINNEILKRDSIFMDTFIKKRMNYCIGQNKTENVVKIIQESHIICVFGMSIGNTDKIWWEEIIKWLVSDSDNKLIIYWKGYEEILKKKIPSTTIRLNEKIRRNIFEKGKGKMNDSHYLNIKERIIISYNSSIFSLTKANEK